MAQAFLETQTAFPRLNLVYDTDTMSWVRMTQPGGSGTGTDEAIRDTLAHYKCSDIDDSGDPQYFGFLTKDGEWYILQVTGGTGLLYAAGSSGYGVAWAARDMQAYGYFNVTF